VHAEPEIRLVVAHAERGGGDDRVQLVVPERRFDPGALVRAVGTQPAYTVLVPSMLRALVESDVDISGFAAAVVGGRPLPVGLRERAAQRGLRTVASYGLTETAGGCVFDGEPLDGVRVSVDAERRIRIAGPVLASGYRLRPEATRRMFTDGQLLTPDAGHLEPDGRLVVA
jgi:O-succinylbenzoic acid--CoA ligase